MHSARIQHADAACRALKCPHPQIPTSYLYLFATKAHRYFQFEFGFGFYLYFNASKYKWKVHINSDMHIFLLTTSVLHINLYESTLTLFPSYAFTFKNSFNLSRIVNAYYYMHFIVPCSLWGNHISTVKVFSDSINNSMYNIRIKIRKS